jgi:hypothetical protein
MYQTKAADKIKTSFIFNNLFVLKILPVRRHVEKYGRATSTTGDNII